MRVTIDYGIDLGTTNSAIARQVGDTPTLIAGPGGKLTLPSAVHLGADGRLVLGEAARDLLDSDPANTCVEFKRLMGTAEGRAFPASHTTLLPEEMSAAVLRELLAWAAARDGEAPRAAVVTIPAMFQLPQCEATRRAAERAGLVHAPLLQEPIAAAIAHCGTGEVREGYWLVYDLGGGTFDVSLVRSRGGRLQVLDHDGDNHLGGRDFDRVLARRAADEVRKNGRLGEFRRSDPALAEAYTRIKLEAERVRIALSSEEHAEFAVRDLAASASGERVGVAFAVERGELEGLVDNLVERTTALCSKVLARNRVPSAELRGLVLVGGPTRMPLIARRIQADLGLEARHVMDPMHIVAAGAALFASTQKLPASMTAGATMAAGAARLQLEYEAMTTDRAPLLVGRHEAGALPASVRVQRRGGGFDSGAVALDAKNAFAVELSLAPGKVNGFTLEALDASGRAVPCEPSEFTVLHGFSVARPPLSSSVGVMLADETMCWYLKKGAVLPARQKVTHATTMALRRGQSGDAVNVVLMQGESARGPRNKAIGVLRIRAEKIARDLPAGTEVEVHLTVDEFSHTTARAFVPLLDQWFDEVAFFQLEAKEAGTIKRELSEQKGRLAKLEALAAELAGAAAPAQADRRVTEIEALIDEGDRDSIDVADQLLRAMSTEMDGASDKSRAKAVEGEFIKERDLANHYAKTHGSAPEQAGVRALEKEFFDALRRGDVDVAEKKYNELRALTTTILWRVPEFWEATFDSLVNTVRATPAAAARASQLLADGEQAKRGKNTQALAKICLQIVELLPKEQRGGFASLGVTSHVR